MYNTLLKLGNALFNEDESNKGATIITVMVKHLSSFPCHYHYRLM